VEKKSTKVQEGNSGKKLARPPSQQTSWARWYHSVIPATQEAEIGRVTVRGQSRQKLLETLSQLIKA
jgi:hypothetical protein